MAVIPATSLNVYLDEVTRGYLRALGTSASGFGIGTQGAAWGTAGAVQAIKNQLLSETDLDVVSALSEQIRVMEAGVSGIAYARSYAANLLLTLSRHVSGYGIAGVTSLESYLTYLNTALGTKWQALQHPNFRDLLPSVLVNPWNCYFEVLQGSTYADALGRFNVTGAGTGVFTDGFAVDQTRFAGGYAQVRVSGLTGTGVVTVTGTALDPATRTFIAGRTWTATVSTNGVTALAPGGGSAAPADSLLTDVSAVSIASGISAGLIYVEAARPPGRPTLP